MELAEARFCDALPGVGCEGGKASLKGPRIAVALADGRLQASRSGLRAVHHGVRGVAGVPGRGEGGVVCPALVARGPSRGSRRRKGWSRVASRCCGRAAPARRRGLCEGACERASPSGVLAGRARRPLGGGLTLAQSGVQTSSEPRM